MTRLAGTIVYKMTGSGNDFVFVDGRASPLAGWTPEVIRAVCDRRVGVGADGFAVLERGVAPGSVRLHYFNRDGGRADLCGNASLCAVRLAGRISLGSAEGIILETDAGPIPARCLPGPGERAEITVGDVPAVSSPPVDQAPGECWARFVRVGVPHLVVLVDDVAAVDVSHRGRELRYHPVLGPAGANVNFVASGGNGWSVRTFERGVEAETSACGSGAVAVASVLADQGVAQLPIDLRTASGCTLSVTGLRSGSVGFADMRLVGEGRLVFRAVLGS
jgi:diaminopimelate epimerase